MPYLIDGYNLLFRLDVKEKTLEKARIKLIGCLAETKRSDLIVVFDGKQETGLGFARKTLQGIEVIYTADGVSADAYILDFLEREKNKSAYLVVTSDRHLAKEAARLKARSYSIAAFLKEIEKKASLENEEKAIETSSEYDRRLEALFLKRLGKL